MSRWQDDKPRRHHYEFAHRALPGIALNPKVDLANLARAGNLDDALRATWAAVGDRQVEVDRIADDGLHGELVEIAGASGVLVTLPVANHAAEAFFVAVVPVDPPESRRYITLEFSWNPVSGHPATMLCEWTKERHANLGPGPDAARSLFVARVKELLGG